VNEEELIEVFRKRKRLLSSEIGEELAEAIRTERHNKDDLERALRGSKHMHSWTLSALNGVLEQLNEETDRNVVIKFIETFLKDSKQEGR